MSDSVDLFGRPLMEHEIPAPAGSIKRKATVRRGYAAPPGTGPAGETCRSCAHLRRKACAKTYLKCWLARARWTGGGGSDVKASSPACEKWEKPEPEA